MIQYEIQISGPGKCINHPLYIITKALEQYGIKVEVDNKYPFKDISEEQYVEWFKTLDFSNEIAIITMKHLPWRA